MSKRVSVAEAKQGFTKLLREAQQGQEEVIVTRRGTPFMVILPYEQFERLERWQAYLEMVRISEELEGVAVSAAELQAASRRELEERV